MRGKSILVHTSSARRLITEMPRWSNILDYRIVAWWKHDNLLLSTDQLIEVGLLGANRQLRLWIPGKVRRG